MFFLLNFLAFMSFMANQSEKTIFEIPIDNSLEEICDELKQIENASHVTIEIDLEKKKGKGIVSIDHQLKTHGQYLGYPRPYHAPLTESEMQDIRFIVSFLANNNLFRLAFHRSELQDAGDRIDHIHPLKFFTFVFTQEDLKVYIRNIRGNGWVWPDFSGGIKESLNSESQVDNMKKEYVIDFAKKINLDPRLILPSVKNKNWDEFIEILIQKVPRGGDHDRYKD